MRRLTLPLLICAAVAVSGCAGTAVYSTDGYYDSAYYGVGVTYPSAYPHYYSAYPYYRTYPYYRSYPYYTHAPYYGHGHYYGGYHARSHDGHRHSGYHAARAAPRSHSGGYHGRVRDHR